MHFLTAIVLFLASAINSLTDLEMAQAGILASELLICAVNFAMLARRAGTSRPALYVALAAACG